MTDKDPKDMTASELLREADSNPCSMCHLVMTEDESCATTGCASWAYRLADKIDAELAQARRSGLERAAKSWAKANGWPDFRDGEDFGTWLNRCALKLPCDKDGEPWHIGDRVCPSNTGETTVVGYIFDKETCYLKLRWCGDDGRANDLASMCKRPAPEVLGADGLPIKAGETVWGILSGSKGIVNFLNNDSTAYVEWDDGRWSPSIYCCNLTRTPPETQERIDDDTTMPPSEYCAVRGIDLGDDPDWETATVAMVRDLLRRQRELDKRKGGAE